jgi:deaminated glutathione amidase
MKIAAIQMVSVGDLDTNLQHAGVLLQQAAAQGAEVAVLPEYFCLISSKDTDKLAISESEGLGKIQQFFAKTAKELCIWLVGGTIPIKTADPLRVSNSVLVYSPTGNLIARYDKVHLFRFDNGIESYDESKVLTRGDKIVSFDLPSKDGHIWHIGLSVCYDMRFPEHYRSKEVDVWLVPSAFTYITGQKHWEILLRARAIENLAYVVAPAQGGIHPSGRRTWGHSMVIDPWGEVLSVLPEGEGVVISDIDVAQLKHHRQQLPALQHRVL